MRALQMIEWKSDPVVCEVAKPAAAPGQVVVRIGGAGVCHSDLHIMHEFDGSFLGWDLPLTIGHENAGWVDEIGEGVVGLQVGQAVAIFGSWGCGACAMCLNGLEPLCENHAASPVPSGGGAGLGADGGMAEYMLVPHPRLLIPIPDGLEPVAAAPLTDAGLTPYRAIRRSAHKLTPTATAVVIGVGGLGHLAIQILEATCAAQVIAVDVRADALKLAGDFGAEITVTPDEAEAAVKAATHGHGAEVVLDFVGTDDTLAAAAGMVRSLGDLTIVGIGGGVLPTSYFTMPKETSIASSHWGSRHELAEVLQLGARGVLVPTITTFGLDDAADVYHRLGTGQLNGRAVIVPN